MKVAKQTEKMFVLENQLDLLGKLNKLNRLRLFAKYLLQLFYWVGVAQPTLLKNIQSSGKRVEVVGSSFPSWRNLKLANCKLLLHLHSPDLLSEPSTNYWIDKLCSATALLREPKWRGSAWFWYLLTRKFCNNIWKAFEETTHEIRLGETSFKKSQML